MPATSPSVTVTSDASGSWGCGAVTSDGQWLQLQWPQSWGDVHIAAKEMVPVVIALALWGKRWQGCTVLCQSDNNGSGGCVENRVSQGQAADAPAALSAFFTAHAQLCIVATHIPGRLNMGADAISRNYANLPSFAPQCATQPTAIPPALVDMLLHSHPDWTSPSWRLMFKLTLAKVWPHQQPNHMHQPDSVTSHSACSHAHPPTTD